MVEMIVIRLVLCSHFLETQHCYAMQLGNSRVWDYVGDNFVHRLLQNKADGKLVEVEGNNNGRQLASSEPFRSLHTLIVSVGI